MLFPKPTSAKILVRSTLAQNIGGVADLYAAVVTGLEDEADVAVGKHQKAVVKRKKAMYRARFLRCIVS
jgi:hypothetical protein